MSSAGAVAVREVDSDTETDTNVNTQTDPPRHGPWRLLPCHVAEPATDLASPQRRRRPSRPSRTRVRLALRPVAAAGPPRGPLLLTGPSGTGQFRPVRSALHRRHEPPRPPLRSGPSPSVRAPHAAKTGYSGASPTGRRTRPHSAAARDGRSADNSSVGRRRPRRRSLPASPCRRRSASRAIYWQKLETGV